MPGPAEPPPGEPKPGTPPMALAGGRTRPAEAGLRRGPAVNSHGGVCKRGMRGMSSTISMLQPTLSSCTPGRAACRGSRRRDAPLVPDTTRRPAPRARQAARVAPDVLRWRPAAARGAYHVAQVSLGRLSHRACHWRACGAGNYSNELSSTQEEIEWNRNRNAMSAEDAVADTSPPRPPQTATACNSRVPVVLFLVLIAY